MHRLLLPLFLFAVSRLDANFGTTAISPGSTPAGAAATVTVTAQVTSTAIIPSTVNLQRLDAQGRILATVGNLRDDGTGGDAVAGDNVFTVRFSVYEETPSSSNYRVSAAVQGSIVRVFSNLLPFSVTGATATGIAILQPANLAFVNTSPVTVSGTTGDPNATVRVNGIQANKSGNSFQLTVPLQEGTNTVTAVASNSNGSTSTASIQVTLDTTPPRVTVDSPVQNSTTTEATITVSGIVNDIVVGTVNSQQATVTVGAVPAVVSNRTYAAANIPLQVGLNTIAVVARDRTGNSATTQLRITREAVTQPFIRLLSGDNQTGVVGSPVPSALAVQLLNGATPVPNTPVIFKVTENDGFLQPGTGRPQLISVTTNAQGQAQASLTLGNRAGAGNNIVEAYATGFQGTAVFTASATPRQASKINVDSGNNQFGPVNQRLALPFVAVVTDAGHNRIANVPVTFSVRQGGGTINGAATFQTTSDSDGRVAAFLTLGSQPGQDNNVVEASFTGNTGFAAAFNASGKTPGIPAQTSISGVVLDNSNNAIPNVTMRVFQTNQGNNNNQPMQVGTPVLTDARGAFRIAPAPVGFYKLMADGTTATQNGKAYPTLEYDLVTVAGQDNTVGMPIYLPELDPAARVCVNETTGGVLRVTRSPGFSLTIAPGSATFPGGSKTGCVSVTPVNPDKVPMVPGFGQQPRYVVTIQPVGTTFNPPAAITIPNMDGLAPGAKTEMYSYDHDLAAFVAIGSATVSPDGAIIASDAGVGVIKAGWHCGGNPNTTGSAGTCPDCQRCQGNNCVPSSGGTCDDRDRCTQNDRCANGVCTGDPFQPPPSNVTDQFDVRIPDSIVNRANSVFAYIPGLQGAYFETVRVGGSTRTSDCCDRTNGIQVGGLTEKSGRGQLEFNLTDGIRVWGTPRFEEAAGLGGIAEVQLTFEVSLTTLRGVFQINVEFGQRNRNCEPRESCLFAEANAVQQVDLLRGTAELKLCVAIFGDVDCAGARVVIIPGRVTFGWGLTFNKPSCNSGPGGTAYLGAVVARGEFQITAGGTEYRIVRQITIFQGVSGL